MREVNYDNNDDAKLLFRIYLFRAFNWPPTYEKLKRFVDEWNRPKFMRAAQLLQEGDEKVFTGAYIITAGGRKDPKVIAHAEAIAQQRADWKKVSAHVLEERTIEAVTKRLAEFPMVGKFVGYEMATDLRHTCILGSAPDIMTWANPGPGARRGCNRIFGKGAEDKERKPNYLEEMRWLLQEAPKYTSLELEMRDIEHSLCEFDKYVRVLNGEGKLRSKYRRTVQ